MSTAIQRYPAAQAMEVAERLLGASAPFCERIVIAGSLRPYREPEKR